MTSTTTSSSIYFHGLPGSDLELQLIDLDPKIDIEVLQPLDFSCFEGPEHEDEKFVVIGFSLGAYSALQLAAKKPGQVKELVLISPAGPLELGDFLPQMAGSAVFQTAQVSGMAFAALTAVQSVIASISPRFLIDQMFADACDAEQDLLKDPRFMATITAGLKSSLRYNASTYRRAIRSYVRPWATELQRVICPCRIFHGDEDTWVPLGMAQRLRDELPVDTEFVVEEGLGHYSTLKKVLPQIVNR